MSDILTLEHDDENARLDALARYDILDTPPDGAFDNVTALAARLFDVPIAIVSLVDKDRIWFKSANGLNITEIDRDPGLCASAVLDNRPYIIEDATKDVRALANPLVAGEFGLRFYAAVPLRTHDGHNLGTLCVIDKKPRTGEAGKIAILEKLAAIVMDQMEIRLQARTAASQTSMLMKESQRTSEKLYESERRIHAILDNASVAIFLMNEQQQCSFMNPAAERLTGYKLEETFGRTLHDVIHHKRPDGSHYPLEECPIDRAFPDRHRVQGEDMFVHRDGSFYPVSFTASPLEDEAGQPVGTIIEVVDISERKKSEEYRELLINELNHRVKNTLSVVQSIAHQTFSKEGVAIGQRADYEARLGALAAAHNILTEQNWVSASLNQLIEHVVRPFQSEAHAINFSGPDIDINPKAAVSFALAIHELATNAVKYGALSCDVGTVTLHWSTTGDRVELVWQESGGPAVEQPTRKGFGSKLITQGLTFEVEAEVDLTYAKSGLICKISAPKKRLSQQY